MQTASGVESIVMANFPCLQQLSIGNCSIPSRVLGQILHKHGKFLVDLDVYLQKLTDRNFRGMLETCNNLRHLCISVSGNVLLSNAHLIASLPNLHSLVIQSQKSFTIFDALAKYQLPNLDYLELYTNGEVKVSSLENFLSNSKPPLRTLIMYYVTVTDKHLDVIVDHLSNTLRILRIDYLVSREYIEQVRSIVGDVDRAKYCDFTHFRCDAKICMRSVLV